MNSEVLPSIVALLTAGNILIIGYFSFFLIIRSASAVSEKYNMTHLLKLQD